MRKKVTFLATIALIVAALPAGAATITALASFDGANGSFPRAGVVADAAGNLYGTARDGGASNLGSIFKFDLSTGTLSAVASFDGTNGAQPRGPLVSDATGEFYGTTSQGGTNGVGTIFKFSPGPNTVTALASFDGANGDSPVSPLTADFAGNLYGTTLFGGANNVGTVFRFDRATNQITTVASFNTANGSEPYDGLTFDAAGNLYGTTFRGGANDFGTIFKVDPNTGALSTLASFDNSTVGAYPFAGVILDARGNLYGTNTSGGANGRGVVFKFDVQTGTLSALASFDGATTGNQPFGRLITDISGSLYGAAYEGGANGRGTIYTVNGFTNSLTAIADFAGTDGRRPYGQLLADSEGNLYGTAFQGGAFGAPIGLGTLFKVTESGFFPPTLTRGGTVLPSSALTSSRPGATIVNFASGVLPFPTVGPVTGVMVDNTTIENVRRAPAGITGNYLSIGFGEVTFDLGGLAEYVGFYAGSLDEYNSVQFFTDSGVDGVLGDPIGVLSYGSIITGTEMGNIFGTPLYGSEYYNFFFTNLPLARYVRFTSTNTAFELGELAYEFAGGGLIQPGGFTAQAAVPAPPAVALFGLAALLLTAARRHPRS